MRNKVALGFLALAAWLVSATSAWAVALGKIDVASHLGEPFYAEVPLQLDPGESLSNVYVELASSADYRILEVYRDPALNGITVDVKSDKRGPRVVLSSDSGIEAPFFNLVLKVRYERATHFKKYPVFLDIPQMAKPAVSKPLPTVSAGQGRTTPSEAAPTVTAVTEAKPAEQAPGSSFKPFSGWARTSRYGPMVYGDTITTVAQRLQVDHRFTRQQVMVALFEKNRAKFDHDNINLIKAGTYLDVPTAAEVEKISPEEAHSIIARQEKEWKQLVKQPKYAAVAEAQKHRYSKRVRVGEKAAGQAAAPMPSPSQAQQGAAVQSVQKGAAETSAASAEAAQKASRMQQQLQQLQQQNSELQGKLTAAQKQMSSMAAKSNEAGAAAANAKVKKLQIQLARLQAQRDEALQKAKAQPSPMGWLTYALLAVIVLLLGLVGYLMRREPAHPAASYPTSEPQPEPQAQHAVPASASSDMFEEAPEIDVEEVPETDFDSMATMQMNAAEVTKEFTDSIPDLTDEDTGKMEAFQEETEEEPDPNVDYLAEADVYLRYGMEDEAVQQVRMALRLDPHNADAHIKLAQVLKAKSDQAALDEAVTEARQSLGGESLQRFEDAVSNLDQVTDAFADTIPPTMSDELPSFEETVAVDETPAAPEAPAEETPAETGAEAADSGLDDLDIEWPEFEDVETPLHEAEAEVQAATQVEEETPPPAAPSQPEAEAEPEETGGDMEFDLSDIEIPETGGDEGEESRASSFVDTSDLEKTVAIDWSQETSVEDSGEQEAVTGDSGSGEQADALELHADELQIGEPEAGEPEVEAPQAEEPQAEAPESEEAPKPETDQSAIDDGGIDLGDFDFDKVEEEKQEEEVQSLSDDEFSSTIRTTSLNINADSESDEEPLFDLSSETDESDETEDTLEIPEDEALSSLAAGESETKAEDAGDGGSEKADDDTGLLLDLGEDIDQTQKLDDLLSEFADEGEKDGDKKD